MGKNELSVIILLFLLLIFFMGCKENEMVESKEKNAEPSSIPKESPIVEEVKREMKDKSASSTEHPGKPILEEKIQEGDLIITNGTYHLNNTKLILRGNLIVNGTGHLVVKDSEIFFDQEFNQQYRAYVNDHATLDMEMVKLRTGGKWFNFQYNDAARVIFNDVRGEDCCTPWHGSSDSVTFSIKNSVVGITMSGNVKVKAEKSSLFFELVLSELEGTYELPQGFVDTYDLVIHKNNKEIIEIRATNSTFTDWGTTLDKYTNITFLNSKMTIGLNAGSDWTTPEKRSPKVVVSGLKNQLYEDLNIIFDTNHLRLKNTFVRDWYPQGFNNATVEISNSDLADFQSNGGTSRIIVRNSKAMIAIARENVTYEFYDSKIRQDVIAHDNAHIFLYNTTVEGILKEVGNGRIYVDGKNSK